MSHIRNGYPGLARLMGENVDQDFGIFRKFSKLNTRTLLYMQAEMLRLDQELDVLTDADEAEIATMTFTRNVWNMRNSDSSK